MLDRETLVNAIAGATYPVVFMNRMTATTLVVFIGNQHNNDYRWNKRGLSKMDVPTLNRIYDRRVKAKYND